MPGERWNTVPWMSWSPNGDRLAYFVRTEKERTLIVAERADAQDRAARSDEDGRRARVAELLARRQARSRSRRCADAHGDIFTVDLETQRGHQPHERRVRRLRARPSRPTASSSSTMARVSGNEKLFRLDLDTKKKTQLTFGTHDDAAAQFIDDDTIVFSSTATDPAQPIEPEVAKNGNIYNIWTLNLKTGELRQYTDALGGNLSPVVLKDGDGHRIAFVTYYKGEYGLHTLERKEPLHTAASADFGAPGPIIDFQAPLTHTLVGGNERKKGRFEKMFLDGPAAGQRRRDEQRRRLRRHRDHLRRRARRQAVQLLSPRRSRSTARFVGSYVNLAAPVPVRAAGLLADAVLLRRSSTASSTTRSTARPSTATAHRDAHACAAAAAFGIYPFNRYRRLEVSGGRHALQRAVQRSERCSSLAATTSRQTYGAASVPQRHDGAARRRVRPGDDGLPRVRSAGRQHDAAGVRGRAEDRQHAVAADARRRRALLPAARRHRRCSRCGARASRAGATHPDFIVLRRQLRDARLRLPAVRRPERRLRQRRAALPADRGDADADRRASAASAACSSSTSAAAWFDDSGYTFATSKDARPTRR